MLGSRGILGVNLTVLPTKEIVPSIIEPLAVEVTVKLPTLSVEFVMASENETDIEMFVATPMEEFAGKVDET